MRGVNFRRHFRKGGHKYAGDSEIVGIAADTRYQSRDIREPVAPMFFFAGQQSTRYAESNNQSGEIRSHYFHIVTLHVAGRIQGLEAEIRSAFGEINSDLTVVLLQSVADMVNENFSRQELIARLTSLFGIVALILASIGMYGITAYSAGRRTAEIGVRMALGADRISVIKLVVRAALRLIAIGLALGMPLTFAMGRLLHNQLYGIGRFDPPVLTVATSVLVLAVFAAAFIPAQRGRRLRP
jgi:ABC-type antimicrobial peptide transport system permease subunit